MANKRQKKKQLKIAFTTVVKFIEEFKEKIEVSIKEDPWIVKEKLLGLDEQNSWALYYISKCNEEIRKRISTQPEQKGRKY